MNISVNEKILEANKDVKKVAKKIPQIRSKFIGNTKDLKIKKKIK